MTKYLILTEKPSARRNFEKALGGLSGHFADFDYELTNLRGHVMTLAEPQDQVPDTLTTQMQSWELKDLPWDLNQFNWKRTYIVSKNPRTGKLESTKSLLDDFKKKASQGFDGIVIATDTDPSGEGDLLAWEAIDAIKWTGPVYRANFVDESEKGLRKALEHLKPILSFQEHGPLQKGLARNKWDFASMQLTRAATTLTKKQGYPFVSRQGRLKSAMILRVYQQLEAIKNYQRVPFFENRYHDENGHTYARAVNKEEEPDFRYASQEEAQIQETLPETATPVVISTQPKETQPPKLLDLASLSAILAKEGFQAKEVAATYQKLYEAKIVSYPRTEDKTITPEQYEDLRPLVDKIAQIVDVGVSLLTIREPRKSHVQEKGAHGANRPGPVVPSSLEGLLSYGPSAPKIYEVLAKNYLAMMADNYHYTQIKAQLAELPNFTTTINQPQSQGWHLVYQDQDEEEGQTRSTQGIGQQARRFLYEGQNKKPTAPTWKWLKTFLERYNIGTGATRTNTYGELTSGKNAYMIDQKGKISLTDNGLAAAILVQDTYIANPKTTKRVFDIFDQVGRFEMTADEALHSLNVTVAHDLPIMAENVKQLENAIEKPTSYEPKEKVSGEWHGEEVTFNAFFSGHRFTAEEVAQLLAGEVITFQAASKKGKSYTAKGQLAKKRYKGKDFIGFDLILDKKKTRKMKK
ncbi:DNA topoisomerase [Fructobacillus cardui]|uniref:DNA topoisomerase IA (TopA) n=1 Tax=Fructobacillus cardui TaxID=2893170 RepID=A0ABM9N2B9_9LACO|nr:DNA topoisomerase IA (TopA) [Fructobacillus cardui]CAK1254881.1 DNA topoisomerase IA (TopA) [Fructobacillus cardui]